MFFKYIEEKIKVTSIRYKLFTKNKKVNAFQMRYSHGIQTPLIKAKDETEDDIQIITLTKKQSITKLVAKRIYKITLEWQFID